MALILGQMQGVLLHYPLTKLAYPSPHLNHHVLHSLGLLVLAEADVEMSRGVHLLHQDLHQLPGSMASRRFEALTLQSVQGHRSAAVDLYSRVHLRHLQEDAYKTKIVIFLHQFK